MALALTLFEVLSSLRCDLLRFPRDHGREHSKRRRRGGLLRYYARPQHMPVLFSRGLVEDLEAHYAQDFARTRHNKLRLGDEIELNFFYHHYLRVARFPVTTVPSSRVEFLFAHRCAQAELGAAKCARLLDQEDSDFVTFNDDVTGEGKFEAGLEVIRRLLRERWPGASFRSVGGIGSKRI